MHDPDIILACQPLRLMPIMNILHYIIFHVLSIIFIKYEFLSIVQYILAYYNVCTFGTTRL